MSFLTDALPFSPTSGSLPVVRFYTDFDPYHVSVDNRPLVDLQSCIGISSASTDTARLIVGNAQFAQIIESLYTKTTNGQWAIKGLSVRESAPLQVTISPGILYAPVQVTPTRSINYIGLSAEDQSISLAAPSTNGLERWVLIQMQFLTQEKLPDGTLPYQDTVNEVATEANFIGGVIFSTKTGNDAAIGSATLPTPDSGRTALAWVRLEAGSASIKGFQYGPGRLNDVSGFAALSAGQANAAPQVTANYVSSYSMSTSSTTTVGYCYQPATFLGGFVDMEVAIQATAAGIVGLDVDVVFAKEGDNIDSLTPVTLHTKVVISEADKVTKARLRIPVGAPASAGRIAGQIKRVATDDTIGSPIRLLSIRIDQ